jgi:hypothetical protein
MAEKLPVRDVVVLLPGILGSVLHRDGKEVWSLSPGAVLRGLLSMGRNVAALELPRDDPHAPDLGDGVVATRLMPDVHLLPGFWKIDGYSKIRRLLFQRFAFEDGANWFDFPYDWRRDNRVAAHRLAELAPKWLAEWRERSGAQDARLILLAHSMGGLVARYYLEELDGWRDSRALVTFGTPYRGSLNALDMLANGFVKGVGPFKADLSGLLRSLTSVHQLLPVYPCVDDGHAAPRKILDASGLPPVIDADRVRAAAGFHAEIAAAVDRNGGYGRYDIHPVVGIFQRTGQSATVRDGRLVVLDHDGTTDDGGDGTVPRVSATPLELSDDPREVYATESHASLQNLDSVLVQVMGLVTRKSLGAYRGSPFDGFRLEVEDLLPPGEPVAVAAETAGPALRVAFTMENVDTGRRVEVHADLDDEGRATAVLPPAEAGVYRVTVSDPDNVGLKPVTDLVMVADDAAADRIAEHPAL